MGKWIAMGVVLLLAGCQDEPLAGSWASTHTGAKLELEGGGECRYINDGGLGTHCTWRAEGERKAVVTISDGHNFVDMEASLYGEELYLDIPRRGLDIFIR